MAPSGPVAGGGIGVLTPEHPVSQLNGLRVIGNRKRTDVQRLVGTHCGVDIGEPS